MKIKYPLPLKNITIRLRREGGLAAYHYELIIHGNGEGIYNSRDDIKKIVTKKGKISQSQIFTLFKHAMEIGFFEMKSIYYCNEYITLDKQGMIQCSGSLLADDFPTYEVEIKIGNQKKKVTDYGGAPKRFEKFAEMIDEFTNLENGLTQKTQSISNCRYRFEDRIK